MALPVASIWKKLSKSPFTVTSLLSGNKSNWSCFSLNARIYKACGSSQSTLISFIVCYDRSVNDNRFFAVKTLDEDNGLIVSVFKVEFYLKLVGFVAAAENKQSMEELKILMGNYNKLLDLDPEQEQQRDTSKDNQKDFMI